MVVCNTSSLVSGKYDRDIVRQCQQSYARGNVLFRKLHVLYDVNVKLYVHQCILRRFDGVSLDI